MNTLRLPFLAPFVFALIGAGCGSIEVSTGGNPERVLNGVVATGGGLPAGAEVVVRLISAPGTHESQRAAGSDVPVMTRPAAAGLERVLGEQTQTLAAGTAEPVPFRIEFTAEDAVLRRGLNLDVRVSFGGRLQYRTVNAHVVTLASSPFKQIVMVQAVTR